MKKVERSTGDEVSFYRIAFEILQVILQVIAVWKSRG